MRAALATLSGLSPVIMTGPARVHLGSASRLTLNTDQTHFSQTGRSDGVRDGDMIVIRDGGQVPARTVRFEIGPGRPEQRDRGASWTSRRTARRWKSPRSSSARSTPPGCGWFPPTRTTGGSTSAARSIIRWTSWPGPARTARRKFGTPGPLPDGTSFLVNELASAVRFEYDNDGLLNTLGAVRITFSDYESTDAIANRTVGVMSTGSGLNIFPLYLGAGEIDLGGDDRHGLTLNTNLTLPATPPAAPATWRLTVPAAAGGVGGVVDGETFTIRKPGTDYVFEFDNNGSTAPGHTPVPFSFTSTQNDVGHAIVQQVGDVAALGIAPQYLGNGVVDLRATALTHTLLADSTVLTKTGVPGRLTPHIPVRYAPSSDFTAADVAVAIRNAVNSTLGLNITASLGAAGTADQRRVELVHDTGLPTDIVFTPDAGGEPCSWKPRRTWSSRTRTWCGSSATP